ncbi:MAG: trans-sulfuration enzyme family protein [Acidobacteriota bacterium]
MAKHVQRIETKIIHSGEPEPRIEGSVAMPIFQSSTYEFGGERRYEDIRYVRLSNSPNHLVLHNKLAALENAEAALVTASGMAAISTTLLTLLASGDHLLAQRGLYGGTHMLIAHDLPALGISCDFIDAGAPDTWKSRLRDKTRVIYVETLSNPLMEVADLEAAVEFAKIHGLTAVIDNTFASPINFRPAEHGFDISLHSGTKYLNGHSDIAAGAVIGRADLIERVRKRLNHLGGMLDPHACFLLHRGIKTLALRVRYQNESALQLSRFLEAHPAVARVNYPGLESHPQHERARGLLDGFSGMLSFELKAGLESALRFLERASIPINAPSLGGPETLVTLPATTSHVGMPAEERRALGIANGLIRMSVGLEATEDLMEDLEQALIEA